MNIAYIDNRINKKFLFIKPEIITFDTGHHLILLPDIKNNKKLSKIVKKFDAEIYDDKNSAWLINHLNLKTIRMINKENPENKLILFFENVLDNLSFLDNLLNENIDFTLFDVPESHLATDYFLETRGIPIKITQKLTSCYVIYFGGHLPSDVFGSNILNLSSNDIKGARIVKKFEIKGKSFPFEINSFSLLDLALKLTGTDLSDIIIKFGINTDIQE